MLKVGQSLYNFFGNWIVLNRLAFEKQSYLKPMDKNHRKWNIEHKEEQKSIFTESTHFFPDLLNEGTISSLIRDLHKNSSFIVPRELAEMASVTRVCNSNNVPTTRLIENYTGSKLEFRSG